MGKNGEKGAPVVGRGGKVVEELQSEVGIARDGNN
jgi:hypothetical protein